MVGWALAYTPADRPPAAFNLDTILLLGKGRGRKGGGRGGDMVTICPHITI